MMRITLSVLLATHITTHAYDQSLADCKAVAAKFRNTCAPLTLTLTLTLTLALTLILTLIPTLTLSREGLCYKHRLMAQLQPSPIGAEVHSP